MVKRKLVNKITWDPVWFKDFMKKDDSFEGFFKTLTQKNVQKSHSPTWKQKMNLSDQLGRLCCDHYLNKFWQESVFVCFKSTQIICLST